MARNLGLEKTRSYLRTSAAKALPAWLRTALLTFQWPDGYAPTAGDLTELVASLRAFRTSTLRKPLAATRGRRPVMKQAG
jgi:hypothetical protein